MECNPELTNLSSELANFVYKVLFNLFVTIGPLRR